MTMTTFRLEYGEAFQAAIAGLQRRFRAIQRQAADNDDKSYFKDLFATDIHGAIAEYTVAKALGSYCNASSVDRALPDVGLDVEVRSSTDTKAPLRIRPRDAKKPNFANLKFYLVVGVYPDTRIVGWMYGKDCVQDRFWTAASQNPFFTEKDPCWAIPQHELKTELIEFSYE